jgi:hypothetical protein
MISYQTTQRVTQSAGHRVARGRLGRLIGWARTGLSQQIAAPAVRL